MREAPVIVDLDAFFQKESEADAGSGEDVTWVPYQGPQGGDGWQNVDTGEVVYDDKPPGADPTLDEYLESDLDELLDAIEGAFGESIRDNIEALMEEAGESSPEALREVFQEEANAEQLQQLVEEITGEEIGGGDSVQDAIEEYSEEELEPSEVEFEEAVAESGDVIVGDGGGKYEGETVYGLILDTEAGYDDGQIAVEWQLPDGVETSTHRPYRLDDSVFVEADAPDVPTREDYEEHLTQIQDFNPILAVTDDNERDEVILEDGRIGSIFRVDGYKDEVKIRIRNDDGSIEETIEVSQDEASDMVVGEVYEDADPSDFDKENTLATARLSALGAFEAHGSPSHDWVEFTEVFERADDDTLSEALSSIVLYGNEADNPRVTQGNLTLEDAWKMEYEQGEPAEDIGTTQSRNIGIITSHMSGEALVETVDNVVEQIDEVYPEEIEVGFSGDRTKDPRPEAKRAVISSAAIFSSDNEAREKIIEKYSDHLEGTRGVNTSSSIGMLTREDHEEWKSSWIGGWSQRGGNPPAVLTQATLREFGPNSDDNSIVWKAGRPYGDIAIPDQMGDHFQKVYEDTQEKLEEETVTLHRGVKGNVTTHSKLESWSELKSIANKFDDYTLEAEVDVEDVFATWETLGEMWPEEDVKGKKEWMVFGGAL